MERAFWDQRWNENRIGFHEADPNALLKAHIDVLDLAPGARVFVPLCGKSFDIDWLLSKGHAVAGIEFHEPAVKEVFQRLGLAPSRNAGAGPIHYSTDGIDLFSGDFFALTARQLGAVDAIYDRAALIALPPERRDAYAQAMIALCGVVPQLLISLNYDQSKVDGPPFSVPESEIEALYGAHFHIRELSRQPISGPLGKRIDGDEIVWHLIPR